MAKLGANLKATFDRTFPERQIYHRSGGTVRYISISPWQQVIISAGVTALAGWTLFATASFVAGGSGTGLAGEEGREIAKKDRFIQDLRAREALQRSLLEERTNAMQKETADLEQRQKALEELLNELKESDGTSVSSLKGDGSAILVEASIEEADSRQSRDGLRTADALDAAAARGSIKSLKIGLEQMLVEAEEQAIERAERARGVLQLTSVGGERMRAPAGLGGPLVSVGAFTSSGLGLTEEDAQFSARIEQAKARIREMRHYESIVESLPLAQPVSVPYRYTSPYGIRVDPFTKRPAAHMGVDLAAYRDAPIVSAGRGTVSFAGTRGGYGLLVEVDHGYGYKSRYGHLRSITVSKGDVVDVGDLVGKMGTTGRSTGDHLHYEVWFNDKPYDPMKFLKAGRHVHQK